MDTQTTADALENPLDGNPRKDTDEQCPVFHLIRENERLMAENECLREAHSALVCSALDWRNRYVAALETLDRANRVIASCAAPMRSAS